MGGAASVLLVMVVRRTCQREAARRDHSHCKLACKENGVVKLFTMEWKISLALVYGGTRGLESREREGNGKHPGRHQQFLLVAEPKGNYQ